MQISAPTKKGYLFLKNKTLPTLGGLSLMTMTMTMSMSVSFRQMEPDKDMTMSRNILVRDSVS